MGNFEDDLKKLSEVDWIIEAVVENLEIKRALLRKVEAIRKPGTIITTNTSGLPVGKIAEGFSDDFRRSWFGTHFFNPPRYMRLLELIPTPEADPAAIDAISHFCDVRLGKGVVLAKDTPNFIGNRIGTFSVLNVMRLMQEMDLSIEEVDALTGQAVGWPKSATFRTIDLVGLDILGHVVGNMTTNVHDERSDLRLPDFFTQMIERKWLGDKTKGGFYKRNVRGRPRPPKPEKRPRQRRRAPRPRLEDAGIPIRGRNRSSPRSTWRKTSKTPALACACCSVSKAAPQKADKAGAFLWASLSDLWTYSANRIPEISDSIVEIDRAMRLGFNWELGPVRTLGRRRSRSHSRPHEKRGQANRANVEKLLAAGQKSWYLDDRSRFRPRLLRSGSRNAATRSSSRRCVVGRRSQRNPTASSRKIPAHRWSISATAWPASSSTPR